MNNDSTDGENADITQHLFDHATRPYPTRKDGQLDARAFNTEIFAAEADMINKPKNVQSFSSAHDSSFLNDSYLLKGLAKAGLTIQELLDANLLNLRPDADKIPDFSQNSDEFIQMVKDKLKNSHAQSLYQIVDVLKKPNKQRIRRSPARNLREMSFQDSKAKNQQSFINIQREKTPSNLEPIAEKPRESSQHLSQLQSSIVNVNTTQQFDKTAVFAQPITRIGNHSPHNSSSLLSIEAKQPRSQQPSRHKNIKTPLEQNSMFKNSQLKQIEQVQERSQEANSSDSPSSGLRKMDGTPFKRKTSPDRELLHGVSEIFQIGGPFIQPEAKENQQTSMKSQQIDPDPDDEYCVQLLLESKGRNMSENAELLEKYLKKPHRTKVISRDPVQNQQLTAYGYKLRAERRKIKRDNEMSPEELASNNKKLRRGDPGFETESENVSSERESSHSSISFDGVPDVDLEHLQDQEKAAFIKKRRDDRRRIKFNNQFRGEVFRSVQKEISYGLSKTTNRSQQPSQSLTKLDPSLLEIFDRDTSFLELRQKLSVNEIPKVMPEKESVPLITGLDLMKERLANAMNFDQEENFNVTFQPDEVQMVNKGTQPTKMSGFTSKTMTPVDYSVMKPKFAEAARHHNPTETTEMSVQRMLKLEASLQTTIAQLQAELIADQQASNESTRESSTIITRSGTEGPQSSKEILGAKTSRILEQAVYVQKKKELIERLKVFSRVTNSTSPKMAEDLTQEHKLAAKLVRISLGKPKTLKQAHYKSSERNIKPAKETRKHLQTQLVADRLTTQESATKIQIIIQEQTSNNDDASAVQYNDVSYFVKQILEKTNYDKSQLYSTGEAQSFDNPEPWSNKHTNNNTPTQNLGVSGQQLKLVAKPADITEISSATAGLSAIHTQKLFELEGSEGSSQDQTSKQRQKTQSKMWDLENLTGQLIPKKLPSQESDRHQDTSPDLAYLINRDIILEIKFEPSAIKKAKFQKHKTKMTPGFKKQPAIFRNDPKLASLMINEFNNRTPSPVRTNVHFKPIQGNEVKIESVKSSGVESPLDYPSDNHILRQMAIYTNEQALQENNSLAISNIHSSKENLHETEEPPLQEIYPIKDIMISSSQQKRQPQLFDKQDQPIQADANRFQSVNAVRDTSLNGKSQKLYRNLVREIEASGDVSSLNTRDDARLMQFQSQGLKELIGRKQGKRKARRDQYTQEQDEIQRLIHFQHKALQNNIVMKKMMLHHKERPKLKLESFEEESLLKSEILGDNSLEGDSTRVYIAKYNQSKEKPTDRHQINSPQERRPFKKMTIESSHKNSVIIKMKRENAKKLLANSALTPLGLFPQDIEEQRNRNSVFHQTSSETFKKKINNLNSTHQTDKTSPTPQAAGDNFLRLLQAQEIQVSIMDSAGETSSPSPNNRGSFRNSRGSSLSKNKTNRLNSINDDERNLVIGYDPTSPRHIEATQIYKFAKADYAKIVEEEKAILPLTASCKNFIDNLGTALQLTQDIQTRDQFGELPQVSMASQFQVQKRPEHSSLSNQKFIEARRRSQNVGMKAHPFKPTGGGFKFGSKHHSKQHSIQKIEELKYDETPGLMIKTSPLMQRNPNVRKVETLKIKEISHITVGKKGFNSNADTNSIFRDQSDENINRDLTNRQKSFFSQESRANRPTQKNMPAKAADVFNVEKTVQGTMFGDWSHNQTRNKLTQELNLLHLISENRFSHHKLPATMVEVQDISSNASKQPTSAFGMSKDKNVDRAKLNIDTTNMFPPRNGPSSLFQDESPHKVLSQEKKSVLRVSKHGKGILKKAMTIEEPIIPTEEGSLNINVGSTSTQQSKFLTLKHSSNSPSQEITEKLSDKKKQQRSFQQSDKEITAPQFEVQPSQVLVQKVEVPNVYHAMNNTKTTDLTISTAFGIGLVNTLKLEISATPLPTNSGPTLKQIKSKKNSNTTKLTSPRPSGEQRFPPINRNIDNGEFLNMLIQTSGVSVEKPQLGQQGYQKKVKIKDKRFEYSNARGYGALNRILGKGNIEQPEGQQIFEIAATPVNMAPQTQREKKEQLRSENRLNLDITRFRHELKPSLSLDINDDQNINLREIWPHSK